ncbi:hypothetical protein GCM10027265_14020 [Jatrophihabitans fulvus]
MVAILVVLLTVLTVVTVTSDGARGATLPAYRCGTRHGGTGGGFAAITDVRVGRHAGFDRFVVQFRGTHVPRWTLTPKSSAVFWLDPSDLRVVLGGRAGPKLVMHGASGIGSYRGPTDLRPRFPQLREARRLGDFEAVTSWGLGLSRASCTRVFALRAPTRLVVDVPH